MEEKIHEHNREIVSSASVERELSRIEREHLSISRELSKLALERSATNAETRGCVSRLEKENAIIKRFTLDDAISTREYRLLDLERNYEELTECLSQATKLQSQLAPGGRYEEVFPDADWRVIDVQDQRAEALCRLSKVKQRINLLTGLETLQVVNDQ